MASSWTSPTAISQSGELETHIPWNSNFSSIQYDDGTRLSTTAPLSHIANSYEIPTTTKYNANQLWIHHNFIIYP